MMKFRSRYRHGKAVSLKSGRLVTAVCLLLLLFLAPISAEEEGGFDFGMALGLGVEAFGNETYQKISLSPDINLGKFGIGLDLTIHYQFLSGGLVIWDGDWIPDPVTFSNVLGLYLAKFKYVRYGLKGDPLYAKFGSIDDGTLGNGFIMGGYANTLFLPERRIFGLGLDVDGGLFNFPLIGIETFVGDLSAFDVLGARLYVRPLVFTSIPLLKHLQVGATVAADFDPFRYVDPADLAALEAAYSVSATDARVFAAGVDLRQPILDGPIISLAAFADLATLQGKYFGGMVGFGGRLINLFTYGAQLRILGENFVPVYFDTTYDLRRLYNYAVPEGNQGRPSYVGWYASLGTALLNDAFILSINLDGPFKPIPDSSGATDNSLDFLHLVGVASVAKGLLPGFSFDFLYDKSLIAEFKDLISPAGAYIRARVNYHAGPAVVSFFYQVRYTTNDWRNPDEITSGLETSIELF
jgi:hypothetical protein